jgi:hypothetical protein
VVVLPDPAGPSMTMTKQGPGFPRPQEDTVRLQESSVFGDPAGSPHFRPAKIGLIFRLGKGFLHELVHFLFAWEIP